MGSKYRKKLIEVALPLDEINAACIREKRNVRVGHPSSIHLWWARRPFLAARAVIWASLVDDPSAHPELFPTLEEQTKERERLFDILKELVVWENSNDSFVLDQAKKEILKSTNNNPPLILDPFMGGGAIPLEGQRLGLKSFGTDLNPVAVMINKAMIEIPPKFLGQSPIHPSERKLIKTEYLGVTGLAEDIEYYGEKLKEITYSKIGHLYPDVTYIDDKGNEKKATIISWIWSRTVKCPNPACNAEVPLIHSFDLSKKKGHEFHIDLHVNYNTTPPNINFSVGAGLCHEKHGTVSRRGAVCPCCGNAIDFTYLRNYSKTEGLGDKLVTIVAEGEHGRLYLDPTEVQVKKSIVPYPENVPDGALAFYPGCLNSVEYGLDSFSKLFTNRQLTLLTTLVSSLKDIEHLILDDMGELRGDDLVPLAKGGKGKKAYAESIIVYLSFLIDRLTGYNSSFCSWDSSLQKIRNVFSRQAIPMVWDYVESNPFCSSSGSFHNMIKGLVKAVANFPYDSVEGQAVQWDATQDNGLRNIMISTDPPYYDNIPYAYLADFFYVWMRSALRDIYPSVFSTMLTPKNEELTAIRYRFEGGRAEAKTFFENGMLKTCQNLYKYSREDIPVTIYYAFKQSEVDVDNSTASTGWETMLSAIINAGFVITGTWPIRTEMENRAVASDANALASSIVIVCRKMRESKQSISMRDFLNELKSEMGPALLKLQAANIAPVDLAQSAIGPGIAVFSRYAKIIQADGTSLSVRDALKLINKELDINLNEQNNDMDVDSSLCLAMYSQKGFNEWTFGEVNTLATARNTSVGSLASAGVVKSGKGIVQLLTRDDLPSYTNKVDHNLWLITQQSVKAYEDSGFEGIANVFSQLDDVEIASVKSLCYHLFAIADKKGWTSEAIAYNAVISCWDVAITTAVKYRKDNRAVQLELDI